MNRYHPASDPDFMPKNMLQNVQWGKFEAILRHTYDNVPWYQLRMKEKGLQPSDIRSLDDIHKLPFVSKSDLRDTYPYGMFAVPLNEIVRFHASSGTTGKPVVVSYTKDDLDVWGEVIVRALACYGVHEGDILQNAYGYGLFTGGLGLHFAEQLGVTVVPISGGNTERQVMIMQDFGVTAVSCTPSYFLHIMDKAEEMGIAIKELPIRVGIFGAEPWTVPMRKNIEAGTGIRAYDIYGLTEIIGPGVGAECHCQNGLHIFEDHFYPEIVDKDTLEPLPDGRYGELVFTTLSKRAMPMIRFRTRDITKIFTEKCPCGRTIRRIERISHRSDDMFIIRGVNVFPGQIESALLAVEGTLPHYRIILTREHDLDNVEVQVELRAEQFDDTIRSLETFQRAIQKQIENTVGIRVKATLVQQGTIPRSEGKSQRVIDRREL
ncbi:MAG TPA: phenylacetate--CoA ligase [Planctomycetaceae bacterium]|nr:phenylacetate--CoA ligase [Planctomycetaceae bacterium]